MWLKTIFIMFLVTITQSTVFRKRLGPPSNDLFNRAHTPPSKGLFEQKLDHFNPTDNRTWKMRYLENDHFFKNGGPMILYIGGEWIIEPSTLMSGQVYDIAQAHNGYMFYTEHRYYGKSYPTKDFSTKNLRYLTIDQTLADLAYFIQHKKRTVPGLDKSKVVVVGCSYPAALATWARAKYPHLIDVAYASSAPLRVIKDFYQYYEVVNNVIGQHSKDCLKIIKEAVEQTKYLLQTENGCAAVTKLYNTCNPVRNTQPQQAYFFNTIAEILADLVQNTDSAKISLHCEQILHYNGTSLEKLAQYSRSQVPYCMDLYEEFLEEYSSTKLTTRIYRQWFYQSCTEFGFLQTTTSEKQPFLDTFPFELYRHICRDLFDGLIVENVLNKSIYRTNLVYGALNPKLSQVVSIHGTGDPWHTLGLSHDLSSNVITILVNGTSHCQDLRSVSNSDSKELKEARMRAKELIAKWIRV